MASVNTNFDNAIRGYARMEEALQRVRSAVKEMQASAAEAKSCLKDSVSQKNLNRIEQLAQNLDKLLTDGEERVRELEYQAIKDKHHYEDMEKELGR